MTRDGGDSESMYSLGRRKLLKSGALVAGGTVVGLPAMAGVAAATGCPLSPGYWSTHDWDEVPVAPDDPDIDASVADSLRNSSNYGDCDGDGDEEYQFGGDCRTLDEWQAFLDEPAKGDKGTILGQQLLATRLNFQRRPSDDGDCVDKETDYFGEYDTFRDVKQKAEQWLRASNFPDEQRDWIVEIDGEDVDGEELKNYLDDFNNNRIEDLDCDCTGEEDEDGNGNDGNDDKGQGPPDDEGQGPPGE